MRPGAFFPALICVLTVLVSALRPDGGYAPSPDYGDFGVAQAAAQTGPALKRGDPTRGIQRPDTARDPGGQTAPWPGAGPALIAGLMAFLLPANWFVPAHGGFVGARTIGPARGIDQDPRIPTGPPATA